MFDMHSNCSDNSTICTQIKKHIHISWQQWEKDILIKYITSDPNSITHCRSLLPDRTRVAIMMKARNMGLRRAGWQRRAFTPEEDDYLRENYHKFATSTIARFMHRSEASIVHRVNRLHIKKCHRCGWYTQLEVSQIIGRDSRTVIKFIESGILSAAREPSLWKIDETVLRRFILRYPTEIGRNCDLHAIIYIVANDKEEMN